MAKKGTIDEEIEREFKTNPELYKRSPEGIAKYMYIQAQLRYSLLRETLENKAQFYRCRLWDVDKELCKQMDKEYKETTKLTKIED
jgi:hypothetical protein